MFPMTITLSNAAQLAAVMAALSISTAAPQAAAQPAVTHNTGSTGPEANLPLGDGAAHAEKPAPEAAQAATVAASDSAGKSAPAPAPVASATSRHTATAATESDAVTTTAQSSAPTPPAVVDFNTLKIAFLDLVKVSRAKAVGILAKHGLAKLSDAPPEQFAEIHAEILGA